MKMCGSLNAPAALPLGMYAGATRIGDWMGPEPVSTFGNGHNIFSPYEDTNAGPSFQHVTGRYTDCPTRLVLF
jgi:hypothetical protein